MMRRFLKFFGIGQSNSTKIDYDIECKRAKFREELNRLELLALESKLQSRDWGDTDNASNRGIKRDNMGSSGNVRDNPS